MSEVASSPMPAIQGAWAGIFGKKRDAPSVPTPATGKSSKPISKAERLMQKEVQEEKKKEKKEGAVGDDAAATPAPKAGAAKQLSKLEKLCQRDEEAKGRAEAKAKREAAAKEKAAEKEDREKEKKEKQEDKEKEKQEKEEERQRKKEAKEAKAARPKGAQSAYLLFTLNERASVVEELVAASEDGKCKQPQVMKVLGERWNAIDEATKQKWEEQAAEDKERHARECAEAGIELKPPKAEKEKKEKKEKRKSDDGDAKSKKKAKVAKPEDRVQPPKDACMLYRKENLGRAAGANPEMEVPQVIEVLKAEFEELPAADLARFEELAAADAERYERDLAAAKEEFEAENKEAEAEKEAARAEKEKKKAEKEAEKEEKRTAKDAEKAAKAEEKETKAAEKEAKAAEKEAKAAEKEAKAAEKAEGKPKAKPKAKDKEPEREPTAEEQEVLDVFAALKKGGVDAKQSCNGWTIEYKLRKVKEGQTKKATGDLTIIAPGRKKMASVLAAKRHMGMMLKPDDAAESAAPAEDSDAEMAAAEEEPAGEEEVEAAAVEEAPKEKRKSDDEVKPAKKAKVVPEAKPLAPPKTAKSALLFYRKENLGRVAEANPDLEVPEVIALLKEEFAEMSADDRTPYEERAEADAERFEREQAAFEAAAEEDDDEEDDDEEEADAMEE